MGVEPVKATRKNLKRSNEENVDYAQREYGITEEELDEFVRRMDKRIARELRAGRMKVFTGDIEHDIAS
jgi:hypothetical protein